MNQFENLSLDENPVEILAENIPDACGCEKVPDCEIQESSQKKEFEQKKFDKERKPASPYAVFLSEYEKIDGSEAKLKAAIDFMELALAQTGSPHFKSFWDARNLCLQLFKEPISPGVRAEAWAKYTELSKEARSLKEILDEQSSFAAEQIEIAIAALEIALEKSEECEETTVFNEPFAESFAEKYPFYQEIQNKLNLLNTQASRINALRKELIRTEMRIKVKNKFFQRLSLIGDKIFPTRKELIKDLSDRFLVDIDSFIETHFKSNNLKEQLFFLREEIKALQGLAKVLTLNTHAFTHTRMRLSDCWDQLKGMEKERKKEWAQQKACHKENEEAVLVKIRSFNEKFAAGEISAADAQNVLAEISTFMRNIELGREEVRLLKEEMSLARKPVLEKLQAVEDERLAQEKEREAERKRLFEAFKAEVEELLENCISLDAEKIMEKRDALLEKIAEARLAKFEKNELEKRLKTLRDVISDKRDEAMLALSDDDKQALNQLLAVLNQRKERRLEIKLQLDAFRKANGSSGFGFEQAMKNNELINEERERLAKMDVAVKEIETLIEDLKKKP
ncbi:MAG TPA: hypothetical protein PLC42_02180 [Parachlamydiaceae bacterium]|nr:hypothetical protein [Parachlamydiaceae bacterium]